MAETPSASAVLSEAVTQAATFLWPLAVIISQAEVGGDSGGFNGDLSFRHLSSWVRALFSILDLELYSRLRHRPHWSLMRNALLCAKIFVGKHRLPTGSPESMSVAGWVMAVLSYTGLITENRRIFLFILQDSRRRR